jgi:hypothetical protein
MNNISQSNTETVVRLYLQLFVGGFMSYLRVFDYLRIVVSKAYCVVVFFGVLFSSCVPYVASYSRLSILIDLSIFSNVYLNTGLI